MPFESGALSFRWYYMPRRLPDDVVERFAEHALPPLTGDMPEKLAGWVTGRHLMDRDIRPETAYLGSYLRMTLTEAERKVPTSLLKAECAMEEYAVMAADGKAYLNRRERSEIKKQVEERLRPQMPPQLKGYDAVWHPRETLFYSSALSIKSGDLLCARVLNALGIQAIPYTPDLAALQRRTIDVKTWKPSSFSPELADDLMEVHPGHEFLTWLWYASETAAGHVTGGDGQEVQTLIEGPLTFVHEGQGAFETVLRKGEPIHSAEAKTALIGGKQLRQSRLTLARGDDQWACTFSADEFVVRGLSLPKGEDYVDAASRFEDRMEKLMQFQDMLFSLYDRFLTVRDDPPEWRKTKEAMRLWVSERSARM